MLAASRAGMPPWWTSVSATNACTSSGMRESPRGGRNFTGSAGATADTNRANRRVSALALTRIAGLLRITPDTLRESRTTLVAETIPPSE